MDDQGGGYRSLDRLAARRHAASQDSQEAHHSSVFIFIDQRRHSFLREWTVKEKLPDIAFHRWGCRTTPVVQESPLQCRHLRNVVLDECSYPAHFFALFLRLRTGELIISEKSDCIRRNSASPRKLQNW